MYASVFKHSWTHILVFDINLIVIFYFQKEQTIQISVQTNGFAIFFKRNTIYKIHVMAALNLTSMKATNVY